MMENKVFSLSSNDKKIAGVCGGIAEYFNLEVALVRMIWVLLTLLLKGIPIVIYLVCWAVMPSGNQKK